MPAVTYAEARLKVRQHLDASKAESCKVAELRKDLTAKEREILRLGPEDDVLSLAILDEYTIDGDFGWVFFYQSKDYLETGDFEKQPLGNAPILVSRKDGSLHVTGTACDIEVYIESFKRCGDPHG